MVSWPTGWRSRSSCSSILTTTAVLDRATTKPSTTTTGVGQPPTQPISSIAPTAIAIWSRVAPTATFQIALKPRRLSSMPTRNSSISTPSSARTATLSRSSTSWKPDGPSTTPATM